jgi:hypothetical protein
VVRDPELARFIADSRDRALSAYSVEKLGEYLRDAFSGGPLTLNRIAIVDPGSI